MLATLPAESHPDLLVGSDGADDAAVYRIGPDQAIVHTADFFTPIVDDPYDFGRIAATNALSDVYAMGGRPLVALNLVAFSLDQLGEQVLADVLRGGRDVVNAAGAVIGGGHTIEDAEPKYGLAVTGIVDPERILRNSGGRAGDALVLTKPLGAGLISTAAKRGLADEATIAAAIEVMTTLNDDAATAALAAGANGCDRRHRLRPGRPPARAHAGERPRRRDRRRSGTGDRRRARAGGSRRVGRGRDAAQRPPRLRFHDLRRRRLGSAANPLRRRDDLRWPARRRRERTGE